MSDLRRDFLGIFESHGVSFTGERGNQVYGYCPFSGKDNKFYVNTDNGLWDSKTAGLSGNVAKFLHLRSRSYQNEIKASAIRQLSENRQLPPVAFREWEVGWDGRQYTFPVRNIDKRVTDIRRYSIKSKLLISTPGCKVGLIGAHRLNEFPSDPVYLCEGEWDAMAMLHLLRLLKEPGVVVGVPGAGTFKKEWVPWFNGRTVHSLYDADEAGRDGEKKILERLGGSVNKLTFVHWPDEVPVGFDTRDWIVYGVTVRNTPEICFERLKRRFYDEPKNNDDNKPTTIIQTGKITIVRKKESVKTRWRKPPTIGDVHTVFNKWLFLRNTDAIDVMLSTVLTQRIDGSPVWLFLVGPPGSAKTAVVSSLRSLEKSYWTSSLTAPSLISGFAGNTDPSLIPKLNNKVLVIKDFTSILSLSDREQKEIFGILRDAYDGRCGKTFGNGLSRYYDSRFTILGATTPRIYDLADQHQALGERFLKFMVGDNLHHESENEIIKRAIENSDRETIMNSELADVVKSFIERTCGARPVPKLPTEIMAKIVALAKFGARMRGSVSRDTYHNDIMMSRPMAEVGTRLGQQLAKLSRGIAMVYGRPEVTEVEYVLIKKVMLDTISQRNEDVLRAMIVAMGGTKNLTPMSMRELATKTHYPFATIQRLMQDLQALQIIRRQGAGVATTWTLSDYVFKEVREAELYTTDELTRPTIGRIRLMKRRLRPHPRKIRIPLTKVNVASSGTKITIAVPSTASQSSTNGARRAASGPGRVASPAGSPAPGPRPPIPGPRPPAGEGAKPARPNHS